MGTALDKNSEADRAKLCYEKAIEIKKSVLKPDDISLSKTYSNMGINCATRGEIDDGIANFQEW